MKRGLSRGIDPQILDRVASHAHDEHLRDGAEDRVICEDVPRLDLADPDAIAVPMLEHDVLGRAQVGEVISQALAYRRSSLLDVTVEVAKPPVVGKQRCAGVRVESVERAQKPPKGRGRALDGLGSIACRGRHDWLVGSGSAARVGGVVAIQVS
jgi:hypothetical protein